MATVLRRRPIVGCEAEDFAVSPKVIGQGAFSSVCRAVHLPTGQLVALKRGQRAMLNNEAQLLQRLPPHPNIVGLFAFPCGVPPCAETAFFVALQLGLATLHWTALHTDLCAVGAQETKRRMLRDIGIQLYAGLTHMHSQDIAHCDLSLVNVQVMRFRPLYIVICDFGSASTCDAYSGRALSVSGARHGDCATTPSVASPQCISARYYGTSEPNSFKCDVWAAGRCMVAFAILQHLRHEHLRQHSEATCKDELFDADVPPAPTNFEEEIIQQERTRWWRTADGPLFQQWYCSSFAARVQYFSGLVDEPLARFIVSQVFVTSEVDRLPARHCLDELLELP